MYSTWHCSDFEQAIKSNIIKMEMEMEVGQLSYGPHVFLSFGDVIVGSHEAGDVVVKTFRDRI